MNHLIYPISILFTICFILYSKYQFLDVPLKPNKKWHVYGGTMRGLIFLAFLFPANTKDIILSIAICVPLFDVGINLIALHENVFYTGTTDGWDKKLGKYKWILYLIFLIFAIINKIIKIW